MVEISTDAEVKIHAWLDSVQLSLLGHIPLTGSLDVRDSACSRSVIVDCNRFPAGFQYISEKDVARGSSLVGRALRRHCVDPRKVHVFTEAHTRLVHYQDNVDRIKKLIQRALPEASVTASSSSMATADYTVLNADLSDPNQVEDAEANIDVEQTCMGWHRRSKGVNVALMSPWLRILARFLGCPVSTLEAAWGVSASPCHLEDTQHARALASQIASFNSMAAGNSGVFVKNASGTYGLGVTWIPAGSFDTTLSHLTRRNLDKMTYARHGQRADRFVIQEAVPTCLFSRDGSALEVVVMCIDGEFCSYFIRKGPSRTEKEAVGNLNAPGSTFIKRDEFESSENFAEAAEIVRRRLPLYKILARIGMVTMAQEQILYKNQLDSTCPNILASTGGIPGSVFVPELDAQSGRRKSTRTASTAGTSPVDREKEFRVMLSDAMQMPFKNRLAKQRFAQEANRIRKYVIKQGGTKEDFAANLEQLRMAAVTVDAVAESTVATAAPEDACSGQATCSSSAPLSSREEKAHDPTPKTAQVAKRNRDVSGALKHEMDVALRKALTTFLQQADASVRKQVATRAQRVKQSILESLREDSVVEERIAYFVSELNSVNNMT